MSFADAMMLTALALCGLMGMPFCVLGVFWLAEWRREAGKAAKVETVPAITFLRPLKRGVPRLREKLELLVAVTEARDQIVFGVDAGTEEDAECEAVRARFPEREIVVVKCAPGAALNPKISKLVQMMPHAQYEHLLLSDSEAMLDAKFLAAFRSEWAQSGADVLTAGYRFVNLRTWPQRLDAMHALLTLWPGLAIVRHRGTVRLTLGACTALRRGDLAAVGGWEKFGHELAEDNRLGAALAKAGRRIRLSAHVATLDSDALSWRDYWRHQRRVAVTYRAANPWGFAGMIFVHVWPWFLLMLASGLRDRDVLAAAVPVLALMLAVRCVAVNDASKLFDFPIPCSIGVTIVASLVESVCWCLAWFTRHVWWGGRKWRVSPRGRLST